jgi:hypothetical protein
MTQAASLPPTTLGDFWTAWVTIPSSFLSALGFAAGMMNRPAGRLGSDRAGPFVVVPGSKLPGPLLGPCDPRGDDEDRRRAENSVR